MLFCENLKAKSENEKLEQSLLKYSYKTPPNKQRLEEEVSKKLSEIRSFENIKSEKSNCNKENCSCNEIRKIFESLTHSTSLLSPCSLERHIDNKFQNKTNVYNIINHINYQSRIKSLKENSCDNDKTNIVKNLISDLNNDIHSTPVLGLKRSLSSSLFKNNPSDSKNNKLELSTGKKKDRNSYYIREIKSKKYNNLRIKYNRNYLTKYENNKAKNENNLNNINYYIDKKSRSIDVKKRSRKTGDQIKQLKEIYKSCSDWNKSKINEVARETRLSENQVYKWIWDQKRKFPNGFK